MKRGRTFFGGLLGGLTGALLAPRLRGSAGGRRAGQALRATLGLRGGSRRFAGTPCSLEAAAAQEAGGAEETPAGAARSRDPEDLGG